jgi:hypothetical protein
VNEITSSSTIWLSPSVRETFVTSLPGAPRPWRPCRTAVREDWEACATRDEKTGPAGAGPAECFAHPPAGNPVPDRRPPYRRSLVTSGLSLLVAGLLAVGPRAANGEWDLGTDRDAFTPCTHTVAAGTILQEASYVYIDNLGGQPTNNYPEWLVRIGATERLEWRFGVNYGVGSQGNVVTSVEVGEGTLDGSTLYETSILYGLKVQTSAQQGLVPETSVILEATTPVHGDVFGTSPVATTVAGWGLPWGGRLDTALRYAYAEGLVDWFSRWTPSVVLRVPVTERFEVHAEWFGNYTAGLTDNTSRPFFSPGTHLMLTRNLEVGVRVGWGLTDDAAPFFSDAGMGWRW